METDASDHGLAVVATAHPAPQVHLARIEEIHTVEVLVHELETLSNATGAEQQAMGFATFACGTLVSTALGWLAAGTLSIAALVVYAVVTAVSLIATLWFGATWMRARGERQRLQARVGARARPLSPPRAVN